MGIEPTALAWEARVLPLYDARMMHTRTFHKLTRALASLLFAIARVVGVVVLFRRVYE